MEDDYRIQFPLHRDAPLSGVQQAHVEHQPLLPAYCHHNVTAPALVCHAFGPVLARQMDVSKEAYVANMANENGSA